MAKQHGVAGEWARVRGTVLSLWPLFLAFTALGAFASAMLIGDHQGAMGGLFALSLVAVAAYWRKGTRRVESFFRGARGEECVATILEGLPDGYHVFNDFLACGHHVDHVLVGPNGLFSIETKNWRGKVAIQEDHILVNGRLPTNNPLIQTYRESEQVRAELKKLGFAGSVTPVLCFASNSFAESGTMQGAVLVVNSNEIAGKLMEMPELMGKTDIERLSQLMETKR